MNILVVGNGGREHALCWKIAQSSSVNKLYCAPGNSGTQSVAENINIDVQDLEGLVQFAIDKKIDLTVVGPEVPLCLGIVDLFKKHKLPIFGPNKFSAQLEGSKCFAKEFMRRHSIPTAYSEEFTDKDNALKFLNNPVFCNSKIVIKADGLAAGKGVIIAENINEAEKAINLCFDGAFGNAGSKVLVEEFLEGEETSILALIDGESIVSLLPSQDHKRVGEGDTGLNTGGMGAYCPAPIVDEKLAIEIQEKVLNRFLNGIQKDKMYYRGIIYAGIMVTKKGPMVLEFNVRFGDPEVQAVMSLLKSDFVSVLLDTVNGNLAECDIQWHPGSAVCVVMASKGYPEKYEKGFSIIGLDYFDNTSDTVVFHAGTSIKNNNIVTSGGRVLGVTSRGINIEEALKKVYSSVDKINWDGAFFRKDIAHRALKK